MPRFFVPSCDISAEKITVRGNDAHHISRALRMAVGDRITVCDSASREYECVLQSFLPDAVVAEIVSVREQDTEPPYRLTLYQALPKGDKLDTVIQKSVECGAALIVPFESERCVVRAKPEAERAQAAHCAGGRQAMRSRRAARRGKDRGFFHHANARRRGRSRAVLL